MTDSLFEIRNLTKSYGERRILDGLTFNIKRGEVFIILGRSGSGKSVTLRQLNGLEKPDAGSVIFDGEDISLLSEKELYPVRRRIAMLFQSGALFDSFNVLENVGFPLNEHTDMTPSEVQERVELALSRVRLQGVLDKNPSALSGGMRKRVALARSLVLEPEVVLFDEPTTGLDPMTAATIGHLIKNNQRELGVTCVVVTHDLALARLVGDRLAFLDHGTFRFLGSWEEADNTDDPLLRNFLAGKEEADAQ